LVLPLRALAPLEVALPEFHLERPLERPLVRLGRRPVRRVHRH